MRLFNLTDIETPELKRRGWVNLPIVVGSALIEPGTWKEVPDTKMNRRAAQDFTVAGAISVQVCPPVYLLAQAARDSEARLAEAERVAKAMREKK